MGVDLDKNIGAFLLDCPGDSLEEKAKFLGIGVDRLEQWAEGKELNADELRKILSVILYAWPHISRGERVFAMRVE